MTLAFVFPGQGSQSVGMLDTISDRPEVRRLLELADDTLGESLSQLIAAGPAEELAQTTNTQPAMLLAGLAFHAAWVARGGPAPSVMAGHSLGEYTALTASGAFRPEDALALVRLRARAMQEAVPLGTGGMAAILGLTDEQVKVACAQAVAEGADSDGGWVEPVNFNAPAQVVIAGHNQAVQRACVAAKALGAKRALPLPVSAPFHSKLLEPAGSVLAAALAKIALSVPSIAVINNVDVAIESDPDRIRRALVRQAFNPVRWVEVVRALAAQGVTQVIEFGPGKVLAGLTGRIDRSLSVESVYDSGSLERVLAANLA